MTVYIDFANFCPELIPTISNNHDMTTFAMKVGTVVFFTYIQKIKKDSNDWI